MRASKLTAAGVVSLFVVGGCGGSGGTPTSAVATAAEARASTAPTRATADPCGLLTQADIKTATGTGYGPSVADSYGHCRWFAGTGTVDDGTGMVSVFFASTGTTLESLKSGVTAGGVDVTVSGHPAYWDAVSFGPSIWVDLGTSVLVIGLDPLPVGGQAMVQHLAEVAVAKL